MGAEQFILRYSVLELYQFWAKAAGLAPGIGSASGTLAVLEGVRIAGI